MNNVTSIFSLLMTVLHVKYNELVLGPLNLPLKAYHVILMLTYINSNEFIFQCNTFWSLPSKFHFLGRNPIVCKTNSRKAKVVNVT